MGAIFSSAARGNRVSSSLGVITQEQPYVESESVDIRIPDMTHQRKVKSKSLHLGLSFKKAKRAQSPSSSPNIRNDRIEIERLKRELELKGSSDRQVEGLTKDREHLQEENARLRKEVKGLNAALIKLRADKEKATLAEKDALERATALEQEKDKSQRQFKMYREAKEKEVQSLLKQLRKFAVRDGSVQGDFIAEGNEARQQCQSISEWMLDNHSVTHFHLEEKQSDGGIIGTPTFIELKSEREMYRELALLHSFVDDVEYGIPRGNVYTMYITCTDNMVDVTQLFMRECHQLTMQYEIDERLLTFCHFPWNFQPTSKAFKSAYDQWLSTSDIFVVFIGENTESLLNNTDIVQILNSGKQCIFTSLADHSLREISMVSDRIGYSENKHHMVSGFENIDRLLKSCLSRLGSICKLFIAKQQKQCELEKEYQMDNSYSDTQGNLSTWFILDMQEQQSIRENILKTQHSHINIEDEIKILQSYVLQDGPVQPLLLTGDEGCGKSYLLTHWVAYLEKSLSNACVLYHIVSFSSPDSRSTSKLLRAFIFNLLDIVPVSCNASKLSKDFPRYLERGCSKYTNGIIIVIDGAQLLDNLNHLKWLLDPLLYPVRVVISVTGKNYPEKWKSWHSLVLNNEYKKPLSMLESGCNGYIDGSEDMFRRIFSSWVSRGDGVERRLFNHQFRQLCVVLICDDQAHKDTQAQITNCISKCNLTNLYSYIIECLLSQVEKRLLVDVLFFLLFSHHGLHLMELGDLVTMCDMFELYVTLSILLKYEMVECVCGLYRIKYMQVEDSIRNTFKVEITTDDHTFRNVLIEHFMIHFQNNQISYRVAQEIPWQLSKVDRKDELQAILSSVEMLTKFYEKGSLSSLLGFWEYLGRDMKSVHTIYTNTLNQTNSNVAIEDMLYDILGEFALDQCGFSLAHNSFEKSLELKETYLDGDDGQIGYSVVCLGRLFTQWKKVQTAEDYYNQFLQGKHESGQADTISYAKCLEWLATLYMIQERTDAVESCRKQAVEIRQLHRRKHTVVKMSGVLSDVCHVVYNLVARNGASAYISYLQDIAVLYFNIQQYKESIEVLYHTKKLLLEAHGGEQDLLVAEVMCKLSSVYQLKMDFEKAEELLEEALIIFLQSEPLESVNVQRAWKNLIKLFNKEEKFDEIEGWHRKMVDIQKVVTGTSSLSTAKASNYLAVHLSKKKKYKEAVDYYHQSIMIYTANVGFQHTKVAEVIHNIAVLFYEQNERMIAAEIYKMSMNTERTVQQYQAIMRSAGPSLTSQLSNPAK